MTAARRSRRLRWPLGLLVGALVVVMAFLALRGPAIEPLGSTHPVEVAEGRDASSAAQGQVERRESLAVEGLLTRETAVAGAAPSSFLHGIVRDSLGGSVPAAEVRLERVDGGGVVVVTTADDGTWRQEIATSVWRARASKDGYGVSVAVVVDAASPQASNRIYLSLLRPVVVRGCVVGNGGLALAGAVVHVRPTQGMQVVGGAASCRSTVTDGAGRFEFEAAAGFSLELSATLEGQQVVLERRVVADDDVEIVLGAPEAFCVRGQVIDEARAEPDFLPPGVVALGGGVGIEVVVDGAAVAVAADGTFVARTGAAVVEVQAKCEDRTSEPVLCRFGCGTTHAFVPLRLRANVPTRGVVVDADGALRAGMTVEALAGEGSKRRVAAACATSADGAFTLQLPVGSQWWLRVVGGEEVAVTAGDPGVRLRCGVGRDVVGWPLRYHTGGPVAGHGNAVWAMLGPKGVVREMALVERVPMALEREAEVARTGPFRAGDDLHWLLREMRPAPWSLFVQGTPARLPNVDRAALREVVLEPSRSATVDVRLTRGGEPVRGVQVSVETAAGSGHLQFATGGLHRFVQVPLAQPALVHVWRGEEVVAEHRVQLETGRNTQVTIEVP